MMIVTAMVAMEKKMPRMRSVSRPTPKPSSPPTTAAAAICTASGAAERLEQQHRGVGADAEEGAGAEIHVAGIAAENVPGADEHDELQDHVAGEEEYSLRTSCVMSRTTPRNSGRADQKAMRYASSSPAEQSLRPHARARRAAARTTSPAPMMRRTSSARSISATPRIMAGDQRAGHAAQSRHARRRRRCGRYRRGRASARPARR